MQWIHTVVTLRLSRVLGPGPSRSTLICLHPGAAVSHRGGGDGHHAPGVLPQHAGRLACGDPGDVWWAQDQREGTSAARHHWRWNIEVFSFLMPVQKSTDHCLDFFITNYQSNIHFFFFYFLSNDAYSIALHHDISYYDTSPDSCQHTLLDSCIKPDFDPPLTTTFSLSCRLKTLVNTCVININTHYVVPMGPAFISWLLYKLIVHLTDQRLIPTLPQCTHTHPSPASPSSLC